MEQEEGSKGKRRPYRKPRMEQVELRSEEAVLGGCKLATSYPAGPDQSECAAEYMCLSITVS